jgi:hypothetical protein
VRDYEQVRRDRREYSEGGRTFYREPGRIIVRDRDGYLIRHDENERFRDLDPRGYRYERRGSDYVSVIDRPGGEQIVTVTDDDGRLLRRYRRFRDGREVLIIDNSYAGPPRPWCCRRRTSGSRATATSWITSRLTRARSTRR